MSETPNQWKLDKRIPIPVLIIVFGQTFAAGVWVSGINLRVAQLEAQIEKTSSQDHRLTILETQIEHIAEGVSRIENKLERSN